MHGAVFDHWCSGLGNESGKAAPARARICTGNRAVSQHLLQRRRETTVVPPHEASVYGGGPQPEIPCGARH